MTSPTTAEITERLRAASHAVRAAEVPEHAYAAALVLAYHDLGTPDGGTGREAENGHAMARLASRLRLPAAEIERVFDVDEAGVHVVVARADLSLSKAQAMRELAHLVVSARQGLGIEEWTDLEAVRSACEDRGVLDPSNFATEIKKVDGRGFRIRGERTRRQIKVNQAGYDATRELIIRLTERGRA